MKTFLIVVCTLTSVGMFAQYPTEDPAEGVIRTTNFPKLKELKMTDNGDGLLDLFVGGTGGLRVAMNEGTAEHPKFGLRRPLLFVDGIRLSTCPSDHSGNHDKSYMTPIDWDGDGALDILATDNYSKKGSYAITFFRGVKTNLGLRFETGMPLFTTEDGSKELPGCQPQITVGDVNSDGVNDIVFGLSIPTVNGYEATDSVAWEWVHDTGIQMPGKGIGEYFMFITLDSLKMKVKEDVDSRSFYMGNLNDEKYLTLRHRSYVFVMYGKKNKVTAPTPKTLTVKTPVEPKTKKFDEESPVAYRIEAQNDSVSDRLGEIDFIVEFQKGWHGYAELEDSTKQEFIPTKVNVELPKGIILQSGKIDSPYSSTGIYFGRQVFRCYYFAMEEEGVSILRSKELPVKVTISYQVCNDQMCLPPQKQVIEQIL